MPTTRPYILVFLMILVSASTRAQQDWTLKLNKENISVYTRSQQNSNLKAIKVECEVPATLTKMVAVILDVNAGAEWVYSTKSSVLLKQVSPSELYYYSEVSLPWPLSNRDFIAHLTVKQHPSTKVVTVDGPVDANYLPEKKGIVRVSHSYGQWVLTPLGTNRIKISYTLETDPGGSIPAWLVNMFVTKGPFETFKKLKVQLTKATYANAHFPFIVD